jgi:hypothetical protein
LTYPSEKYEFVSWDDDIPNIWKVIKVMFQTTNQLYTVANMGLIPSIIWVVSTSFKPSPKKKTLGMAVPWHLLELHIT